MAHPPLDYSTDETTRLQVGASTLQQQARLPFHAFLNSGSYTSCQSILLFLAQLLNRIPLEQEQDSYLHQNLDFPNGISSIF